MSLGQAKRNLELIIEEGDDKCICDLCGPIIFPLLGKAATGILKEQLPGHKWRWIQVTQGRSFPRTTLHLPVPLLLGQSLCCFSCQHFWTLRFYSWISPRSHCRPNRNTFPSVTSFPLGVEMGAWKPSTFLSQTERTLQGYLSPGSYVRSAESFIITASQLIFFLENFASFTVDLVVCLQIFPVQSASWGPCPLTGNIWDSLRIPSPP